MRHSHRSRAEAIGRADSYEGERMQYIIGFIIALFIALTGVGAGTVTVPVLVLFLGVPAPIAVGIGLMFATAVKLILVPAQIMRRNVAWRTLGFMLMGGIPGVIIGSLFLKHLVNAGSQNLMNALLGTILVTTAAYQIFVSFRPQNPMAHKRDRTRSEEHTSELQSLRHL